MNSALGLLRLQAISLCSYVCLVVSMSVCNSASLLASSFSWYRGRTSLDFATEVADAACDGH